MGSNPIPAVEEMFPGLSKDEVPQTGCSYRARLSLKWPESWLGPNSRTRDLMEKGTFASLYRKETETGVIGM